MLIEIGYIMLVETNNFFGPVACVRRYRTWRNVQAMSSGLIDGTWNCVIGTFTQFRAVASIAPGWSFLQSSLL